MYNATRCGVIDMKKVLLIVLALLFIGIAALGVWQRENIAALCVALKYRSAEEIAVKEKENEQKTKELLTSLTDLPMRELSEEERAELESGKLSEEEAKNIVKGGETEDNGNSSAVDDIIARIYVLRAQYLSSLDALLGQAKAEVLKIPEEKRTTATLLNLGDVFIARGTALEGKCDAQMEALLTELSQQLKKENKSTKIISEIRSTYVSEKRLKKAALYSKYYPK